MQLVMFEIGRMLYHPNKLLNPLCPPYCIGLIAQLDKPLFVFTFPLFIFLYLPCLTPHRSLRLLQPPESMLMNTTPNDVPASPHLLQ